MPTTARQLIDALLAGDAPSASALLAADASYRSPVRDYAGAEEIGAVWRVVAGVIENARPTTIHEQEPETVAFFAGTIKDQPVEGVVRALTNADDRVSDVVLMVRPWQALKAGLADVGR